jgi:hypothetical protein
MQLDPDSTGELELPAELAGAVRGARRMWEAEAALDEALIASMDEGLRPLEPAARDALLLKITRAVGKRRPGRPRYDVPAPLWTLLRRRSFDRLPEGAADTLWLIACSTDPARPMLTHMAAVAAVALWLHGPDALHTSARQLLTTRALAVDPVWLHQLAREITAEQGEEGAQLVLALARMQRRAGFVHGACVLAAVGLLAWQDRWLSGSLDAALERVCDRVSLERWRLCAPWIELMASAGLEGRLRYAWLERVVDAALRLRVGQTDAQTSALRSWHEERPYEASDRRLVRLYGHLLRPDQEAALRAMLDRIEPVNALRAQRLIEVWAMLRLMPRHPGPRARRLTGALAKMAQAQPGLSLRLARLYVQDAAIGRVEAAHVRRHLEGLDGHPALSDYLLMSDYVGAFTAMRCDLAGITMHHADKHAASRVGYFMERQQEGGRVSGALVRSVRAWPEEGMPGIGLVRDALEHAQRLAQAWLGRRDGSAAAVRTLRHAGARIERFEDIKDISLDTIEAALVGPTSRRLFVGMSAGLVTGGLATIGPPALALLDLPILLGACVDTCARFCWLYGFDPRIDPSLPLQILAVALDGPGAQALSPEQLHESLSGLLLGRAATLAGLRTDTRGQGALSKLASSAALPLLEGSLGPRQVQRARLALRTLLAHQAPHIRGLRTRRVLPMAGAALGAAFGATLLYDICEAAQIVLTDRFLARKYSEWPRHL